MTTQRVEIIVSTKGAVTVKKELADVGRQARQSAQGVDLLRDALSFISAGMLIRGFVNAADGATRLANAIKLTGQTGAELAATQERLYQIAIRNGQSVNELGGLYQKLSATQKNLGITSEGVNEMISGIAAGMRLSTASTQAQQGALQQLNQMLGNNVVQMQEVNSLLDGAYPLMQAAARGSTKFKGDVAALTNALRAGGYSTKQFFAELKVGLVETERTAANLPLTIGQSMTALEAAFQRWISTNDSALSAANLLAQTIQLLANNFDTVALVMAPVIVGLGLMAVRAAVLAGAQGLLGVVQAIGLLARGLTVATQAVLVFNAASLANPWVLVGAAIAAAVVTMGLLGKAIMEHLGIWDDFKKTAIDAINSVLAYVEKFLTWVSGSEWKLQIVDDGAAEAIEKAGKSVATNIVKAGDQNARTALAASTAGGKAIGSEIKTSTTTGSKAIGASIDTNMTTGSVKIKDSIDQGTTNFADTITETFSTVFDWFAGLFGSGSGGADAINKAANNASNKIKAAGNSAGNSASSAIDKSANNNVMRVSEQGNRLVKVIEGSGETAGQSIARAASSASSAIGGAASTGGSTIVNAMRAQTDKTVTEIRDAGRTVGKELARLITGLQSAEFLPGGGMISSGYAKGGQFKVGGSGGTDSQRVQFMASPNERVTVETPAQRKQNDAMRAAGAAASAAPVGNTEINNVVVLDPNSMVDVMNTKAGSQVFMQFVELNRDEVRRKLGVK